MDIKLVVAVTDGDWFKTLRQKPHLEEVNFWAPSGTNFKALQPGELFLLKLHAPYNVIVGGGVFAYANVMPCSLAWEAFGEANGAETLQEMRNRISRYRNVDPRDPSDFKIGCRILTQPFFFDESEFIDVPPTWSPNIVSLKKFSTGESDGRALWDEVNTRLKFRQSTGLVTDQAGIVAEPSGLLAGQALFGKPGKTASRSRCFQGLGNRPLRPPLRDYPRTDAASPRRRAHPSLHRRGHPRSQERNAAEARHPRAVRFRICNGDPGSALRGQRTGPGGVRERARLLRFARETDCRSQECGGPAVHRSTILAQ